jgi:hypothetical protein
VRKIERERKISKLVKERKREIKNYTKIASKEKVTQCEAQKEKA